MSEELQDPWDDEDCPPRAWRAEQRRRAAAANRRAAPDGHRPIDPDEEPHGLPDNVNEDDWRKDR